MSSDISIMEGKSMSKDLNHNEKTNDFWLPEGNRALYFGVTEKRNHDEEDEFSKFDDLMRHDDCHKHAS